MKYTIIIFLFLLSSSFSKTPEKKIKNNSVQCQKDKSKIINDTLTIKLIDFNQEVNPTINIENKIPEESTDYFTPFFSIFALIFGFALNKGYDYFQNKIKIKNVGKQWVENYIQLINPLGKQIEFLKKYIPENDENNFNLKNPSFQISLKCTVFDSLDDKSLVPYLLYKKIDYTESILLAGKIKDSIEIIKISSKKYSEIINTLKNASEPYMVSFNENLNDFKLKSGEYLDLVLNTYPNNTTKYAEAMKMKTLLETYIYPHVDNGEFDLFKLLTEFIEPFFKATYIDRDTPLIKEIIYLLNHCDRNIKGVKMEKKYFRIKLEQLNKTYEEQFETVNNILKQNKLLLK